jgi:glycosyltransferase involved in cell wall biosynthesis
MSNQAITVAVQGEGRRRFTPPWRQALAVAGFRLADDRPDLLFVIEGRGPAAGGPAALVLADPPPGAGGADAVIATGRGRGEAGIDRIPPFVDAEQVGVAARERAHHRTMTGIRLFLPADSPRLVAIGPGAEEGDAPWRALARSMARLVTLPWHLIALADPRAEGAAAAALTILPRQRVRVVADEGDLATLGILVSCELVLAPAEGRVPLALLQAQVAGVPAVAFRGTVAASAIPDGITGMLAAPGNLESFANMTGFLLRHGHFRRTFGANALKRSFDDHDLAGGAHVLGQVLRDALTRAGRRGGARRAGGMLGDQG